MTSSFCQDSHSKNLLPETFVARTADITPTDFLGSIQCRIWAGPIPWVVLPETFQLGAVWGLNVTNEIPSSATKNLIEKRLVDAAVAHLQACRCSKVVALAQSTSGRDALLRTGFQFANMLTLKLSDELVQRFRV